jgi:hypothetical protein
MVIVPKRLPPVGGSALETKLQSKYQLCSTSQSQPALDWTSSPGILRDNLGIQAASLLYPLLQTAVH